jgi:hypothetical protein
MKYTIGTIVNALNSLKFKRTPRGNLSLRPEPIDHCHPKTMNNETNIIGMKIQKKPLRFGGPFSKDKVLNVLDM